MGRMNQAMQRARQSGVVPEFELIPASAYDVAVLAAEPFPSEVAVAESPAPVAPPAPVPAPAPVKADTPSARDDREIKEIFFSTYHEKVWSGN